MAPRLEPRADRPGRLADPALDDVEDVPAVIGEDAAARDRGVEPPVAVLVAARCRRPRPERLPHNARDAADPSLTDELARPAHDRRVVPVVDGVEHAPLGGGEAGERRELAGRAHERLLAEHVQTPLERRPDQRRVARRRRADVHEVEGGLGQERLGAGAPGGARHVRLEEGALGRARVRHRDDLDVAPATPAGHVAVDGDVAEADDRAPQHPTGARAP